MERETIMNVAEAKAKLSELMERAERGENVIIARKGKAVVRLVATSRVQGATPKRANFFGKFEHLGPVPEDALSPEPMDAWFSEQPIDGFSVPRLKVGEPAQPFDFEH